MDAKHFAWCEADIVAQPVKRCHVNVCTILAVHAVRAVRAIRAVRAVRAVRAGRAGPCN